MTTKRSFRSQRTTTETSAPDYPTFELGRRSFLRKLGLLAAGVAAGGALVGCGERNVGEGEDPPVTFGGAPDAKPSFSDSGLAPMPDAGIDTRPPYAGVPKPPDAGIDLVPPAPDTFGGVPDMKPADLDTKRDVGAP